MTNKEFIKMLEYEERIMRELHGVHVAMPFKAALESARAVVDSMKYSKPSHECNCEGDWSRVTGAAPKDETGRDGWHIGG